ncbi:MAG: prolipoprotein diacylglyceryl transferase [Bdellovibrionota bacterium]
MIPYFYITKASFWGVDFYIFDLTLVMAWFVGMWVVTRYASIFLVSQNVVWDLVLLSMIFGFLGAHWFHVFLYEQSFDWTKPWSLMQIWSGLSSTGGFLGGALACMVYLRRKNIAIYPVADLMMFGLVPALMVGRIGCFLSHDHIGRLTSFPLAVNFPGGPRHDTGGYEMVLLMVVTVFEFCMMGSGRIKTWKRGAFLDVCWGLWDSKVWPRLSSCAGFGIFGSSILGYDPAQYVCLFFVMMSIWILRSLFHASSKS